MMNYIIAILVIVIVLVVIHIMRIINLANRFLDDVDCAVDLKRKLFDDENTAKEYHDKKIEWFVVKWDFWSENFGEAVKYLNIVTQSGISKYEKLNKMTSRFDFTIQKETLEDIAHDTKMWLWKHGYFSDENENQSN